MAGVEVCGGLGMSPSGAQTPHKAHTEGGLCIPL